MGFATIIGLLVASYVNINIGENSIYPTNANNIRIDNLDLLKEHIVDAETGVRGYIVTRDETFLEPYTSSLPLLKQDLDNIKKSYMAYQPNERALIDQLGTLIKQRITNLGMVLQAVRGNNHQEAIALMYAGKPVMDEIRNNRNTLRKLLVGHHEEAMTHSLRGLNLMEGVVYFLGISTITLLIVWFAATQRQQRLRDEFDQILLERNYALEMKVQTRTEELVALAGYLSNARESEKANLARELHDELGALLTAAKHDAGWVERKLSSNTDPAILERMARLQQNLSSVIGLTRNLINNLRPAMLHDLGLLTALRNLADEFASATDIKVNTELPTSEINLPEPMALAVFRIVQEAFTNSRKYAEATEVQLELFEDKGTLILNLYDNGVGFDQSSSTIARHGLAGMKHRVQMLKGKIEIVTSPGKGVLITVEVPIPAPGALQNRVIADRRQSGLPHI
jgi:protein-histidine pros-kinase